jgi:formyltetrahydrofolate deformylase
MTEFVLTLSADRPGIVAAVSGLLARRGGNITEPAVRPGTPAGSSCGCSSPWTRPGARPSQVLEPPVQTAGRRVAVRAGRTRAEFSLDWELYDTAVRPRVLILVSRAVTA